MNWVKVVHLINVDQGAIINFVQSHIIYRFGIPETLTIEQGTFFTGRKMVQFALDSGIKLLTSTPYNAQENGQFEVVNKSINRYN